jgi:transposase-like protein
LTNSNLLTIDSFERTRRRWTNAEKKAILREVLETGNVSAVARRHGIASNVLFTWRKRYSADQLPGNDSVSNAAGDIGSPISELSQMLGTIDKLQALADLAYRQMEKEINSGACKGYSATCGIINLVNATYKLQERRDTLVERLTVERAKPIPRDEQDRIILSFQEKREAEKICMAAIQLSLALKQ